jgi:hypothetical protein
VRRASAALVLACLLASPASAQYFGGNKVQYKRLDFQVLTTEHFDIYFYPEAREGVDIAARMSERWLTRLERLLGHELRGRQPLVLYASHPDFEQTNAIQGQLGEGTGGVTESVRRRIILPLGGPLADTDHVIGHELVHAFQFDITTRPGSVPGDAGAQRLPLWFIEGMAEYLSIGPVDSGTAMWLRDAAREGTLPTVDDLNDPRYFPYRWGQAFWAYVGGKWGDEIIGEMLRVAGATGDTRIAIQRLLGVTTAELSEEWHAAIRRAYDPVLAATTPPSDTGRLAIRGAELGGDLNLGPAISPDGRWIAFLSERSLFSIDLFVADAATGAIIRRLTSTGTDPHFSSLQFIHSAGAWSADSTRIAIATVTSGRAALAIFEAQTGRKQREIQPDGVDEIFNPTWAPDGRAIGFTGMSRGLTDLYMYDLETSTLRQLTKDPYADLQPAWSPDGRSIAFATDRFSTNLATLDIGSYGLALIDVASGRIESVTTFEAGKSITPQWAPDGRSLYFISDHDGIANLYRVSLDGAVQQLTRVSTGLSGITKSSPALSVGSRSGIAAFTVYDQGNYHIYTLAPDAAAPAEATAPRAPQRPGTRTAPAAATLPPVDRRASDVAALLANDALGLPAPQTYEVSDYRAGLQLDGIGQPTIAVGADRFGAAIGGGIALYFSDMLGDQNLVLAAQINSGVNRSFSFKDTAAQAGYFNQKNRWNWGVIGGQVPYLSGGIRSGLATVDGEPALVEETILFRQTERSVAGVLAYPFNRAQRIEFQGGVSQMTFDRLVQSQAFSLRTGALIAESRQEESVGEALTMGTSAAALVYDTSAFGATSPVQGQRYRFEAAPTFGTINFTSLLADYRRYFMPVSLYTVATRVMHYGRYGSGGEDSRLFPLFIGYPSLVRGYDVNSIGPRECVPDATSSCPAFDRLLGSRLLVANLEFRFPLLRPFGLSRGLYGPVPVEVAFFADGGVAWNRDEKPELFGGSRQGVASVGTALRINLFGFAVGEFDIVRPLQRPGKGWMFQFQLAPGF